SLVRALERNQFHNNLGRIPPILGSLVSHPKVRRGDSEPEISFRKKETEQTKSADFRAELHLVAVKFTGGRSQPPAPTYFEPDVIYLGLGLVRQKVKFHRTRPFERQ